MSDTPRTDKESFFPHDSKYKVCDADFARQLERELNAANDMFRKLNIHALNLTDRIKRLEEAGDAAIHEAGHGREHDALEIWNKAKEDKL
jgi:hypothetical protein